MAAYSVPTRHDVLQSTQRCIPIPISDLVPGPRISGAPFHQRQTVHMDAQALGIVTAIGSVIAAVATVGALFAAIATLRYESKERHRSEVRGSCGLGLGRNLKAGWRCFTTWNFGERDQRNDL